MVVESALTGQRVHDLLTLRELYEAAERTMSQSGWEYLQAAAGTGQTAYSNLAAFRRWRLTPQALSGVLTPDLTALCMGIATALPVLFSPLGSDKVLHASGAEAIAAVARERDLCTIIPEAASTSLEEIGAAGADRLIMGLHAWGEPREFLALANRAANAGYSAIAVTVDCPTLGRRDNYLAARAHQPESYFAGNDASGRVARRLHSGQGSAWTWRTFREVRREIPLPVAAKGILSAEDAVRAADAGADAVIISNHGGRQIDYLPATLECLPDIVRALSGKVQIGIDGGIRTGMDVLVAIALGADFVGVGRPVAASLGLAGVDGVNRFVDLLEGEIRLAMTLLGRGSFAELQAAGAALNPTPYFADIAGSL